eukprot:TRINITY_DN11646_c0_g1_i1.p1 TRINITY_DN11646_c0_g1~~TRINITY_DN11646_c0_g1_i1.p1  ORF type:complete len:120 (-),score=11.72 TRINITY_DN11646_c0_g1_i1:222-581(-)
MMDKLVVYRLGKMYQNENEHKLAVQTFFQGIEYEPESWLFWYEAGDSLFGLKDYAQSIQCFEQCNLLNNNESHSWIILSLCYLALKEPKKANKNNEKKTLEVSNQTISQRLNKQNIQNI